MRALTSLIKSDGLLILRDASSWLSTLFFFLLTGGLVPLAIGPEADILARVGVGIIWILAIFSVHLSQDFLFRRDYETGLLDFFMSTQIRLEWIVLSKSLLHWLVTAGPLIFLLPILSSFYSIDVSLLLIATLMVGMLAFTLIGAVGGAATLGASKSSFRSLLIVFPLYIPVLVFGCGAMDAHRAGPFQVWENPYWLLLLAFTLFAIPFSIYAAAAYLRLALQSD